MELTNGELNAERELFQSSVLPFVVKNIRYIRDETAKPNNFNNLKTSDEFRNLMALKIMVRNNSIHWAEITKEKVNALIVMINKELNK